MIILRLKDLFERDLEIVYDCEHRLSKGLPKMIKAVSSAQLKSAFESDLEKATDHVGSLKRVFASLNRLPTDEPDHALKGIFNESERLIKNIDRSALLDAALLIFGREVHHHKIALYGSLGPLARTLDISEAVTRLDQAKNEERASDETLTQIGASIYVDAVHVLNSPHDWLIV